MPEEWRTGRAPTPPCHRAGRGRGGAQPRHVAAAAGADGRSAARRGIYGTSCCQEPARSPPGPRSAGRQRGAGGDARRESSGTRRAARAGASAGACRPRCGTVRWISP
ncbi:hypothetical protein Y09_1723 [Brachybacterium sp. SW0106-09]|nr:hypothetical protein Y09_1723 [Brachybacterium sp. SW0106-09]